MGSSPTYPIADNGGIGIRAEICFQFLLTVGVTGSTPVYAYRIVAQLVRALHWTVNPAFKPASCKTGHHSDRTSEKN